MWRALRLLWENFTKMEEPVPSKLKKKWFAIAVRGFALPTLPYIAQIHWVLITPDQDARDRAAPHVPAPLDIPPPPRIDLVRPDISKPLQNQNPVTIEVSFIAGTERDRHAIFQGSLWIARNRHHQPTTPACRERPE